MSTYRIDGIKYNPANWAGLDPSERAACTRFAAARERELNTIEAWGYTCAGGPFDGAKLEIESTTDTTAQISVRGWIGVYRVAGSKIEGGKLSWVGNDAGAAVNTHGAATSNKAAPEITGKGFDQLRDLLAEMAEDPADREEITTSRVNGTFRPGCVDDFGDEYTPGGRGAWAIYPANTPKFKKKIMKVTPAHGTGENTPDDFGRLFGINQRPAYSGAWLRIVRRARYTIGRTTYTVPATAAAVDKLRARLIKIKKWLSDKMLTAAGPGRTTETIPDIAAAMAATLAIAQAQASAATAHQGDTTEAFGELVTVDCPDSQADAYIDAIAAHDAGDLSEAIAAIQEAQGDVHTELATVCSAEPARAVGSVGVGSAVPANSGPTPQIEVRSPQSDHHSARASATHGVGGGEGRPFENEINPSAFLGDVPLSLAVQAHNGTSFSPEKRGARAQKEHADTMAADYKEMHAQAVRGGTLDLLPEVFARYRARQASAYRAYLASSSRIVSSFIVGPANFPAARMNKRADIAHRRLTEYLDGGEMAKRAAIRTLRPDLRAIMAGDADAVDRLTIKINAAERSQAAMKEANKAIRQHAKAGEAAQLEALMSLGFTESQAVEMLHPRWGNAQGFPSYRLTNNNANIRRMRERLEQITKAQACEVVEIEGADGIRLEDDAPANRVRLFFPGKPAAEIRDTLKARGFRWAPSVGAWQAYRNTWTLKTAQEMAGKPSEADPVEMQQAAQEVAPEIPAEIAPEVAQVEPVDAPAPAQAAPIEPAAPTPCEPVENTASEAPALPEVAAEPSDNTPPKNGTGFAQQASSKVGAWVAALYRDTQGAHVLRFDMAGMAPVFHSFKTRGTMLASLQALGSAADRGHLAHFLSGFSVLDSSGAEVRSMAPAIFQALRDHLEDINYHTEALMVSCFRAGRDDLAAGVAHLVRFQAAPGYEGLPSDMAEARAAVSRVLRGEAPGPISPEAAARLAEWGLSFDPAPTPPAPQQADTPPGVGGAAHPILESAPAFTKVVPFSLDPCTILQAGVTAEQLVGLGVVYLGNAANASGEGAITSATESRQFGDVQMVCTLEDGRVINASRYSFTGEVRPIFQFNGKMHGAPYLAQLSAVRAALKAQHSSAQAIAQAEHVRQLETLAAEFPQLERKGKNSAGKLAAINIRKLLKQSFKAVKFSVTSDYNSARVRWEDGPTAEQVNAVIGRFDIGHSDCNSDYFYTTETAWSQLFGGVQYLTTSRSTSDTLVSSAIAQAFSGASLPEDATPKAWRNASGAFSWNTDGGQMYSRRVREILSKTPA